jgi:hypothetical protein
MRSCLVKVDHIRFELALELLLMEDQQVVEALLSHTPHEAFADRVGSGSVIWGLDQICCRYHRSDIWELVHTGWLLAVVAPPRHRLEIVSRRHGSPCVTSVR